MLSRIWTGALQGIDALPIVIETNLVGGMPSYTVVGLPDSAVRESRDRIRAALKNCGLPVPRGRITVNLAPADVKKEGAAFDLPLAMGLLAAHDPDAFDDTRTASCYILGELALDGTVRPVRGALPLTLRARQAGMQAVLVPACNASEAAVVEGISVFPIQTLHDAVHVLSRAPKAPLPFRHNLDDLFEQAQTYTVDFSDVRGQQNAKRALEVAASGGHNVLMVGPPGAGKTMLAKRLPTILPPLSRNEALETTKIHSVSGKLKTRHGLVATRPFRAPHHTVSDAGLCGGGAFPRPGEISLAHNGVLFLDELPEFKRQVLEVMRQPMEEGTITISRAQSTINYPARFMLVASMNPCPCGHLNDPQRTCVCAPPQVQRYLAKISGPLLDRIDLHIEITPVPFEELNRRGGGETSSAVRERVVAARAVQLERFRDHGDVHCNAQMGSRLVRTYCQIGAESKRLMQQAIERLGLSARAYDRLLKVGRTIADLADSETIEPMHLAEAIQYRSLDRSWWSG